MRLSACLLGSLPLCPQLPRCCGLRLCNSVNLNDRVAVLGGDSGNTRREECLSRGRQVSCLWNGLDYGESRLVHTKAASPRVSFTLALLLSSMSLKQHGPARMLCSDAPQPPWPSPQTRSYTPRSQPCSTLSGSPHPAAGNTGASGSTSQFPGLVELAMLPAGIGIPPAPRSLPLPPRPTAAGLTQARLDENSGAEE